MRKQFLKTLMLIQIEMMTRKALGFIEGKPPNRLREAMVRILGFFSPNKDPFNPYQPPQERGDQLEPRGLSPEQARAFIRLAEKLKEAFSSFSELRVKEEEIQLLEISSEDQDFLIQILGIILGDKIDKALLTIKEGQFLLFLAQGEKNLTLKSGQENDLVNFLTQDVVLILSKQEKLPWT